MKRNWMFAAALVASATLALVGTGCDKLIARDHINKGITAFKANKYPEAVEHFRKAMEKDPTFPIARLYLATALRSQWIPGAMTPENIALAKSAKEEFQKVLEADPKSTLALAQLASINFDEAGGLTDRAEKNKKFDESGDWHKKLIAVDPNYKSSYYSLGVIAWSKFYPSLQEALNKAAMKPEDQFAIKDKKIREQLRTEWGPTVEDGIANLRKAVEIDKEYDEAMAYLNLLIRERAFYAETPEDYKKDIAEANDWVQKSLDAKKLKAQRELEKQGAAVTKE